VDAGSRPIVPAVTAAARYGPISVFFHDDRMYPEPAGFWTHGRRIADVTVAVPPNHSAPVILRLHSGGAANRASFSTFGWQRDVALVPGEAVEIELPAMTGGIVPLTIAVEDGFYPRDLDPATGDQRFLGIWVEVRQP
jgi:hypothetical protein